MEQEFIVGNWYQNFYYPNTKAKFLRLEGRKWVGSEWIYDDKEYIKEIFNTRYYKDVKPISIEEIKQFLPEGHPDLQNVEPHYEIY